MSIERPACEPSIESTHGGPEVPWETLLGTCDGTLGRGELAAVLVERGYAEAWAAAIDLVDASIARGELVSDGRSVHPPSRQSNLNKSVNSAAAENLPSKSSGEKERPSVEEKVREFVTKYPKRATLPLADIDGVSLRRDYAEIETEEWVENQPDVPHLEAKGAVKGESVSDVSAVQWGEAVRTLLEKYERTKQTSINLEKGSWRTPDVHAEFSVQAENRWFASYQKKYYAQLDAWLRELSGGVRPSGGETEASFDNPHIALITRSASSTPGDGRIGVGAECKSCGEEFGRSVVRDDGTGDCPECEAVAAVVNVDSPRVGPVTHAEELQDSWEPVYNTLRNTLRSEGYELGESWQYDRRLEPHTGRRGNGKGTNECYGHEHIILVVDGDVTASDLRPVIDKHVEACEWAGEEAHGEGAIEVREPDELNDVAAYVADYCSIDPVELWEREPAYIAWAASMDAGNVKTVSRSETAAAAAKADACRQRAESEEANQEETHGESVRRVDGEIVCSHCGTVHDIDQSRSLVEHRIDGPTIAADGGTVVRDRVEELRERYPNAEAAATVGESPQRHKQREAVRRWIESDKSIGEFWATEVKGVRPPDDIDQLIAEIKDPEYDPSEVVGFDDRVPSWHVKSVTVDGEERPASAGNGVDMVEVTNVRQRLVDGLEIDEARKYRCDCGVTAFGESIVSHLRTHGFEEPERAGQVIGEESTGE